MSMQMKEDLKRSARENLMLLEEQDDYFESLYKYVLTIKSHINNFDQI